MVRVMHVASSVIDPAAGTDYAVNGLCRALSARGNIVEVHTLHPAPEVKEKEFEIRSYPRSKIPAKLGLSHEMSKALVEAAANTDVVHGHSLWTMQNLYAAQAARRVAKPYVFSVHGMMAPAAMRRSRFKKTVFGWMGQWRALSKVDCFHATSNEEYADIRHLGYKGPVSIVPFGIDLPTFQAPAETGRRTLLFLGRIHPIKRIDVLLMAWRAVQDDFRDWDLVICGPDNDEYLSDLQQLAKALGTTRVDFSGPKYGAEKSQLLASAHLFVLPSYSENFGFVVAEALAHGVPAIVSKGAPWAGLEEQRCGWWVEISAKLFEQTLREALVLDERTLSEMGHRGRDWMARDFSWNRTAESIEHVYQWLLGKSERPECIVLE